MLKVVITMTDELQAVGSRHYKSKRMERRTEVGCRILGNESSFRMKGLHCKAQFTHNDCA